MTTRDEILSAALQLPEFDRLTIAGQLLDTVANDSAACLAEEEFLDELDSRAGDLEGAIPAEALWQRAENSR